MSRRNDIPDEDAWTFDKDAGDYRITLEGTAEFGAPHVTSITVAGIRKQDGKQITVTRDVLAEVARHLAQLADEGFAIHRATETRVLGSGTIEFGGGATFAVKDVRVAGTDPASAAAIFTELQTVRRRRLTTDDLQRIAEAYKDAQADGRPVIAAVADVMTVSKSRAAHLIKEARKAGLIPPAARRGNSNAQDE